MRKICGMPVALFFATSLALSAPAFSAPTAPASQPSQTDQAAIVAVLEAQTAAWNCGDIESFMQSYEDSPATTFIGSDSVRKGFQPILERYKKNYSSHEQMGTLTFKDLDVRLLPSSSGATEYAVVTGRFHLDRTTHGAAGKDDGIFSLVWHKSGGHWKILLDHTA